MKNSRERDRLKGKCTSQLTRWMHTTFASHQRERERERRRIDEKFDLSTNIDIFKQ